MQLLAPEVSADYYIIFFINNIIITIIVIILFLNICLVFLLSLLFHFDTLFASHLEDDLLGVCSPSNCH